MPLLINGTDLFQLCEWGGKTDKHAISTKLLLSGKTFTAAGNGLATPASSGTYIYSSETYTPKGLYYNGSQVVLQKPGCRPLFINSQKTLTEYGASASSVARYLRRFTDGEVWLSTGTASRTGQQLSWPTTGTTLPRGVRYVTVFLVGGGGGGGGAGGSLQHSGSGGGGGACAVCCVKLPENSYAAITIGGYGAGGTNYSAGSAGGYTRIDCGSFWCQAGGGAGGQTSTSSSNTAAGGTVTSSGNNADGYLIAKASGGSGPGKNKAGNSASFTIAEYAPESASDTYSDSGGASGGSSGGGGGGASAYGKGGAGGNGAAGGDGWNFGGGGGGGGIGVGTKHAGGRGAGGCVVIRY